MHPYTIIKSKRKIKHDHRGMLLQCCHGNMLTLQVNNNVKPSMYRTLNMGIVFLNLKIVYNQVEDRFILL